MHKRILSDVWPFKLRTSHKRASHNFRRMQRATSSVLLLLFPSILHVRVIKWEGKPISVPSPLSDPQGLSSSKTCDPPFSADRISPQNGKRNRLCPSPGAGDRRHPVCCWRKRNHRTSDNLFASLIAKNLLVVNCLVQHLGIFILPQPDEFRMLR